MKFKELIKTHDIVYLAKKLALPQDLISYCNELGPLYFQSRYPDASGVLPSRSFDRQEANEYLNKAKKVVEWIQESL
jgi:HEPN domain-containing protein